MKPDTPGSDIVERLQEAIDRLHQDVHKVEVWAGALGGYAKPVPGYQAGNEFLLPATVKKSRDGS